MKGKLDGAFRDRENTKDFPGGFIPKDGPLAMPITGHPKPSDLGQFTYDAIMRAFEVHPGVPHHVRSSIAADVGLKVLKHSKGEDQ